MFFASMIFKSVKILMQKFINGSILFILIKSGYKRPSFWSYNKMTIVRVKLVKTASMILFFSNKTLGEKKVLLFTCEDNPHNDDAGLKVRDVII